MKSLGFVVLNPESNASALRMTTRTIKDYHPECPILCVMGQKHCELKENSNYADVVIGGETITSLIDAGIQKSKTEWCFIITAGSHLRYNSLRKHKYFLREEKDILYPVVDRKYAFDEASINGILMPKKAIEEVGRFGNGRNLQLVKLLWGTTAIEKGYTFKAIVGARII